VTTYLTKKKSPLELGAMIDVPLEPSGKKRKKEKGEHEINHTSDRPPR